MKVATYISVGVAIVSVVVAGLSLTRDYFDITFSPVSRSGEAIEIDPQSTSLLPRCLTLTGTAPIEDDSTLWVAHRGQGSPDIYLHRAERTPGTEEWQVGAFLGDDDVRDARFEFFAFYIEDDTSDFISSFDARAQDGGPAYVYATELPLDEVGPPQLEGVRDPLSSTQDCGQSRPPTE